MWQLLLIPGKSQLSHNILYCITQVLKIKHCDLSLKHETPRPIIKICSNVNSLGAPAIVVTMCCKSPLTDVVVKVFTGVY